MALSSSKSAAPRHKPAAAQPQKTVFGVEEAARPFVAAPSGTRASWAVASAMDEARAAGLLDGGDKEHISVRVPRALLAEAHRLTGLASATELVTAALALSAQGDPVADFMDANFGKLGKDFQLEY